MGLGTRLIRNDFNIPERFQRACESCCSCQSSHSLVQFCIDLFCTLSEYVTLLALYYLYWSATVHWALAVMMLIQTLFCPPWYHWPLSKCVILLALEMTVLLLTEPWLNLAVIMLICSCSIVTNFHPAFTSPIAFKYVTCSWALSLLVQCKKSRPCRYWACTACKWCRSLLTIAIFTKYVLLHTHAHSNPYVFCTVEICLIVCPCICMFVCMSVHKKMWGSLTLAPNNLEY